MIMNYKMEKMKKSNPFFIYSVRHFEWISSRGGEGALLKSQIHRGANEKWSRFRFVFSFIIIMVKGFFFIRRVTPC